MNQLYAVRSTTTENNLEVFLGEYESLYDAFERASKYSKEYGHANVSHEVYGSNYIYISNDSIQFQDGRRASAMTFPDIDQYDFNQFSDDFKIHYSKLSMSIGQEYGAPYIEQIREKEVIQMYAQRTMVNNSEQLSQLLSDKDEYRQLQKDKVETIKKIESIEFELSKVDKIRFSKEMMKVSAEKNNLLEEMKAKLGFFGRLTQSRTISAEIDSNNAKIFHYGTYANETLISIANRSEGKVLEEALAEVESINGYISVYSELFDDHSFTIRPPVDFSSLEVDHSDRYDFEIDLLNDKQDLEDLIEKQNNRIIELENPGIDKEIDILKQSLKENLEMLKLEDLDKIYTEAIKADVEGWAELAATEELTGITDSEFNSAYIVQDLQGRFEEMNGDKLTKYYEKLKFGEWEHTGIISGSYEDGDYILDESNPKYVEYLENKKLLHCQKIIERYPEKFFEEVDIKKLLNVLKEEGRVETVENTIDEQMSKEILNKVIDTYPYQATVGEVYGIISVFDEDPLIGKNFISYDEALRSELQSIKSGEKLSNVFEKISLNNYEVKYLKDNYGIDAEGYKELANQRVVLTDARDKLLQLMDTDSYSRDERLITTQQKVVDQELSKLKSLEQKLNNVNIAKQQPIQSIPKGQAFSMALNYSLADEVGYLKFVEELDEMISTIDNPSEVKGCLTIVFDGDEILSTENVSLEEIKNKICTADAEKIIDFAKETLREKITSGDDLGKYTQQYTTAIGVEKELAESMIQTNELPIEGGISIG